MNEDSQKPKRKDDLSCIQLSKDTKAKLDELGTKKDTYESIILRIMGSQCVVKPDENEVESE